MDWNVDLFDQQNMYRERKALFLLRGFLFALFSFFLSINIRYLGKWRFLVFSHFTDADADDTSDSHKTSCVSWIAVGVTVAVAAAVCTSLM